MFGISEKAKVRVYLIILSCLLILALSITLTTYTYAEYSKDAVMLEIRRAFKAICEAYNAGGDVKPLVNKLNEAILLLENYTKTNNPEYLIQAHNITAYIIKEAPIIKARGEESVFWNNLYLVLEVSIVVVLAVLAYLYLPKIYLLSWFKARSRDRVVVRRKRSDRKYMIINEEVWAVILAILIVGSVFAISQAYLSHRVIEPFSELGLLGKHMKIGDYPRKLIVGEEAFFYVYVGNHMGRPMYYIVMVKIGNRSTPIDPAPLKPVLTFERVLMNNETWIFPVHLKMSKPGINLRIIVELWIYNETTGKIQYHNRWTQLWVNVTKI